MSVGPSLNTGQASVPVGGCARRRPRSVRARALALSRDHYSSAPLYSAETDPFENTTVVLASKRTIHEQK
jgi:hypothetical protein